MVAWIDARRANFEAIWDGGADLPVAHELGETSLMFLVHPTLETRHIELTCRRLREVMAEAAA